MTGGSRIVPGAGTSACLLGAVRGTKAVKEDDDLGHFLYLSCDFARGSGWGIESSEVGSRCFADRSPIADRAREGRSIASVRILPLSETDRRTAPVELIRGRLKARRADYYVRMRPRTDGSVPMALGGTLPEHTQGRL